MDVPRLGVVALGVGSASPVALAPSSADPGRLNRAAHRAVAVGNLEEPTGLRRCRGVDSDERHEARDVPALALVGVLEERDLLLALQVAVADADAESLLAAHGLDHGSDLDEGVLLDEAQLGDRRRCGVLQGHEALLAHAESFEHEDRRKDGVVVVVIAGLRRDDLLPLLGEESLDHELVVEHGEVVVQPSDTEALVHAAVAEDLSQRHEAGLLALGERLVLVDVQETCIVGRFVGSDGKSTHVEPQARGNAPLKPF